MGTWLSLFSYYFPDEKKTEKPKVMLCKLIIISDESNYNNSNISYTKIDELQEKIQYCNRPVYSEKTGLCKKHHLK